MRKLIYSLLLTLSAMLFFAGCQDEDPATTEKFKVTFDSKGGSAVSEMIVEKGQKITRPSNPTNGEYLFVDWFKDDSYLMKWDFDKDVVEGHMTLYAKWTTVTYKVTFSTNGGSAIEPITVAKGSSAIKPVPPTKEGAAFDNWYKEAALTNVYEFNTAITADITLYAKWTVVDREALRQLLDEVGQLKSSNYTTESFNLLQMKTTAAYLVLENEGSTSAQIITAYTQLSAAMSALVALPKREVASVEIRNTIDGVIYINPDTPFSLYAHALDGKQSLATDARVTFEYDTAKLATWVNGQVQKDDNSLIFTIKTGIAAGQTLSITAKSAENPAISQTVTLKISGKEEIKTLFLNAVNALPEFNK